MKTALITGITGQDGSYLAELLLGKGYQVHGIVRRSSSFNRGRIEHLLAADPSEKRLVLHYGDIIDASNLNRLLEKIGPDEIYNLAAQSHVKVSFEIPDYTAQVDGLGTLRLLDCIRELGLKTRFYQASTSELYGRVQAIPQSETTPFYPRSPYGAAKLYAYWLVVNYREAYNLFACNGILFNHESPRRSESFVTRKITLGVARIHHGSQTPIVLGNLNAKRDWGYAPEYVEGMWQMLQQQVPDDFVMATGETHSVREFVDATFNYLDLPIEWSGEGPNEKARLRSNGRVVVEIDRNYYRPTEVDLLVGDASKAKRILNWEPKTKFQDLVRIMIDADLSTVGGVRMFRGKLESSAILEGGR